MSLYLKHSIQFVSCVSGVVHSHICSWNLPSQSVHCFSLAESGPIVAWWPRSVEARFLFSGLISSINFAILFICSGWNVLLGAQYSVCVHKTLHLDKCAYYTVSEKHVQGNKYTWQYNELYFMHWLDGATQCLIRQAAWSVQTTCKYKPSEVASY